ncbi:hypothetical protein BJY52DRAFT_1223443 [Lactarius psammicola]|nr:hypothetical protein BJY52DRAFT_1223443 [Lactarius psammicola]
MRYHGISVRSVLAAISPDGLAKPLSPRWDDMRTKHSWNAIPKNWESLGRPPSSTTTDLYFALKPYGEKALIDSDDVSSGPRLQSTYSAHLSKKQLAELIAPYPVTLKLVNSRLEHHGVPSSVSMTLGGNTLTLKGMSVTQANALPDASYQLCKHVEGRETTVLTVGYALPAAAQALVDCGANNVLCLLPAHAMADTAQPLWRGSSGAGEAGIGRARDGRNVLGIAGYLGDYPSAAGLVAFACTYRSDAADVTFTVVRVNGGRNILRQPSIPRTISTSHGFNEDTLPREYTMYECGLFAQLGARGVSVLFATGNVGVGGGKCVTKDGSVRFRPKFSATWTCGVFSPIGTAGPGRPPHRHTWQVPGRSLGHHCRRNDGLCAGDRSECLRRRFLGPLSSPELSYQEQAESTFVQDLGSRYQGLYKRRSWPRHPRHRRAGHQILSTVNGKVQRQSNAAPVPVGLGIWRPGNNGEGTFQKAEQTERSFPGTGARLDVVQDHAVACSNIPASARHPSDATVAVRQEQLASLSSATHPAPANLIAKPQHDHPQAYPTSVLDAVIYSNRSCASFSIHSRASDRLSIIQSHSHESLHTPLGQPKENPKAAHRQFGCGPSTDHLEVSHSQVSSGPTGLHGHRKGQSSTSVIVGIESPSTESLPRSNLVGSSLLPEPYSADSPTVHSSPASNPPDLAEESPQLTPTATSSISDFDLPTGRFLQPRERRYYEIRPLTTTFPHVPKQISPEQGSPEVDCAPWIPATHPDGALYFFDKDRRLFTDTNMHNLELKEEMEEFYNYLQKIIRHEGIIIPSNNYDLVLDIMPTEDGRIQWSYYYACHENRCLFWLDAYEANHMISEVFWVTSPAHVKHRLEALYWTHWSLFPAVFDGRCLQPAVYDELVGILSHGCMDSTVGGTTDVMTSKSSTLPYDDDTMQKMIKLVRKAKESESDAGVVYHTAGITHWRFLYIHGQQHARLIRHQTVYSGVKQERSLLIKLLSPVLFLAPEVHLQDIKRLWTDEIIIETVWKSFMTKLVGEWEELILWSTVMLTANVGFLAIPGVLISNMNNNDMTGASQLDIFVSPPQIASSISILASVGSIVIGLLLVRHNRSKQKEDPAGASNYLYKSTHRIFGLEPMAIIFSLPWALLMWAMVMFFIALLLFSFYHSNTPTRIFVAVASAMLATLVGSSIRKAWESSDRREEWSGSLPSIARTFGHVRVKFYKVFVFISRRERPSLRAQDHA